MKNDPMTGPFLRALRFLRKCFVQNFKERRATDSEQTDWNQSKCFNPSVTKNHVKVKNPIFSFKLLLW